VGVGGVREEGGWLTAVPGLCGWWCRWGCAGVFVVIVGR
jgi:hypothetical protein